MQDTLNKLIEEAQTKGTQNKCPCAQAIINGKTVEAYVVKQTRITTSRKVQKPSVTWKVNGKRVSAQNLTQTIEE